jgi:hypothetical protein
MHSQSACSATNVTSIGEWCQFQRESRDWSVTFDALFAEWLSLHPSKSWFWHFAGNEEEVTFVAELELTPFSNGCIPVHAPCHRQLQLPW